MKVFIIYEPIERVSWKFRHAVTSYFNRKKAVLLPQIAHKEELFSVYKFSTLTLCVKWDSSYIWRVSFNTPVLNFRSNNKLISLG